jgi:hypothetical protein
MGKYDVYVFCNECLDVHRMGTGIILNEGPKEKQSIANAYAGKEIPPNIRTLLSSNFQCPHTGKAIPQEDPNEIFLVPVVFI